MTAVGKVRGAERLALLRAHRLAVFDKVFSEYCKGRASCDDVLCRAEKLKELGIKR